MRDVKLVLLCDDGSAATGTARDAAIHLATHWHAALHVLNVGPVPMKLAQHLMAECVEKEIACATEPGEGDVAGEIRRVALEQNADLVVLGSRSRSERRFNGGSVGHTVISNAEYPVLIVREDTWPPTRLVMGDDGSKEANAAAELAADIASDFDACALLVDAMPEVAHPGHDPVYVAMAEAIRTEETDRLAEDALVLQGRLHGRATGMISNDTPAVALRENATESAAQGNVLVAVGSTGKTEMARNLGWSVSSRVAEIDGVSVLVVPRLWLQKQEQLTVV